MITAATSPLILAVWLPFLPVAVQPRCPHPHHRHLSQVRLLPLDPRQCLQRPDHISP
jgi:hypothetical protein